MRAAAPPREWWPVLMRLSEPGAELLIGASPVLATAVVVRPRGGGTRTTARLSRDLALEGVAAGFVDFQRGHPWGDAFTISGHGRLAERAARAERAREKRRLVAAE